MNILSIQDFNNILDSNEFKLNYNDYITKKECSEFSDFINSIELNKKYFRLEMNKKKGYRNKHKNMSDDTIAIKEITSLLNKVSDKYIEASKKTLSILSFKPPIKEESTNVENSVFLPIIFSICFLSSSFSSLDNSSAVCAETVAIFNSFFTNELK